MKIKVQGFSKLKYHVVVLRPERKTMDIVATFPSEGQAEIHLKWLEKHLGSLRSAPIFKPEGRDEFDLTVITGPIPGASVNSVEIEAPGHN